MNEYLFFVEYVALDDKIAFDLFLKISRNLLTLQSVSTLAEQPIEVSYSGNMPAHLMLCSLTQYRAVI